MVEPLLPLMKELCWSKDMALAAATVGSGYHHGCWSCWGRNDRKSLRNLLTRLMNETLSCLWPYFELGRLENRTWSCENELRGKHAILWPFSSLVYEREAEMPHSHSAVARDSRSLLIEKLRLSYQKWSRKEIIEEWISSHFMEKCWTKGNYLWP